MAEDYTWSLSPLPYRSSNMPVEKQEVFLERVAVHREQAMLTPLSGQSHRSENHLAF